MAEENIQQPLSQRQVDEIRFLALRRIYELVRTPCTIIYIDGRSQQQDPETGLTPLAVLMSDGFVCVQCDRGDSLDKALERIPVHNLPLHTLLVVALSCNG